MTNSYGHDFIMTQGAQLATDLRWTQNCTLNTKMHRTTAPIPDKDMGDSILLSHSCFGWKMR